MEDDKYSTVRYAALVSRLADESDPSVRLETMQQMLRFEFEWVNRALDIAGLNTSNSIDIRMRIIEPIRDAAHHLVAAAEAAKILNGRTG